MKIQNQQIMKIQNRQINFTSKFNNDCFFNTACDSAYVDIRNNNIEGNKFVLAVDYLMHDGYDDYYEIRPRDNLITKYNLLKNGEDVHTKTGYSIGSSITKVVIEYVEEVLKVNLSSRNPEVVQHIENLYHTITSLGNMNLPDQTNITADIIPRLESMRNFLIDNYNKEILEKLRSFVLPSKIRYK